MVAKKLQSNPEVAERRHKPRICIPFLAKVEGVDSKGKAFAIETVLDNVSAAGLYLRLMQPVDQGAKLSMVVRLNTQTSLIEEAPSFSMEGVVLRAEEKTGGVRGVAVFFDHVRFH